jgi:hypothetical protein
MLDKIPLETMDLDDKVKNYFKDRIKQVFYM